MLASGHSGASPLALVAHLGRLVPRVVVIKTTFSIVLLTQVTKARGILDLTMDGVVRRGAVGCVLLISDVLGLVIEF